MWSHKSWLIHSFVTLVIYLKSTCLIVSRVATFCFSQPGISLPLSAPDFILAILIHPVSFPDPLPLPSHSPVLPIPLGLRVRVKCKNLVRIFGRGVGRGLGLGSHWWQTHSDEPANSPMPLVPLFPVNPLLSRGPSPQRLGSLVCLLCT